jgi:hypothetical protein
LIFSLARSLRAARSSEILKEESADEEVGREMVCLWEETKMGALPPGIEGRLGIGKDVGSVSVF